MPIDRQTEQLLTLAEAAAGYKPHPVSYDAVHKWATHGKVRRFDGALVKLEAFGSPLKTSREAIDRFEAALSDAGAVKLPTPKARARRQAEADRRLDELLGADSRPVGRAAVAK